MGIKLPPGESVTGRSRFEAMVQEYAVSQLRSWCERRKASTGKTDKYVSTGFKRTANSNKSDFLKPRLALSVTDKSYHAIRQAGSTIELNMVVNQRWVTFIFKTPERFTESGIKIIAPTISIDDRNRVMFNWPFEILESPSPVVGE